MWESAYEMPIYPVVLYDLIIFGFSKGDLKIQKEKLTDELFKLMRKLQSISQSVLAKEKVFMFDEDKYQVY